MKYYQATVSTVSEFADTVSVILIELGSEGVSVTDCEDVKKVLSEQTWDYADDSLFKENDPVVYVSGYYGEDYDFGELTERLNSLRENACVETGPLELGLKLIDSSDYENEWKKYYVPIELERIAIVPEWIKYDGDKMPIYIDPGMAFGTGSHETTKLCLSFLEKQDLKDVKCADIGCGSGILGAAALKLGAKTCFMSDIDGQAVQSAHENCVLNGVEKRAEIFKGSLPERFENEFSCITANITADVLVSLCGDFYRALEKGGTLIMSGIIHSRAADVEKAFCEKFLKVEEKSDGEWRGIVWKKN